MTFVPPQICELSAGIVFISSVGISTMSTYLYKGRRGSLFPLGSSRVFEENLENDLYFFRKKDIWLICEDDIDLILKVIMLTNV